MAGLGDITAVLDSIQKDVPGFIACSVVDLDSGMALAVKTERSTFDLEGASALNSELVKQKLKTIHALNLSSSLDDMLLTLSDQLHLIKLIGEGMFIYLAADRGSTNLAIMRSAVTRHTKALD